MEEKVFKYVEYLVWALILMSMLSMGISALFCWGQIFVAILCGVGAFIWYHFKRFIDED